MKKEKLDYKWKLFLFVAVANIRLAVTNNSRLSVEQNAHYHALIDKIVERKYGQIERPVLNRSDTILIRINVGLFQIINLDLRQEYFQLAAAVRMTWVDQTINWDPKKYGGQDSVVVSAKYLWQPDIVLFNYINPKETDAKSLTFLKQREAAVVIQHTGSLLYTIPVMICATCLIDLTWFPVDTQRCTLSFESWNNNLSRIYLQPWSDNFDTSMFQKNNELDLVKQEVSLRTKNYEYFNENFTNVEYVIWMRRRPLFFVVNFIIPSALIEFLAVLVFLIPPNLPERIAMAVTLVLGVIVLLLVYTDQTPVVSQMSLLGLYILKILLTTFIITIVSLFLINASHWKDHKWPNICHFLNTTVAKILHMKDYRTDNEPITTTALSSTDVVHNIQTINLRVRSSIDLSSKDGGPIMMRNGTVGTLIDPTETTEDRRTSITTNCGVHSAEMLQILREISTLMKERFGSDSNQNAHTEEVTMTAWLHATMVVDRILFLIVLLITLVTNAHLYVNMIVRTNALPD